MSDGRRERDEDAERCRGAAPRGASTNSRPAQRSIELRTEVVEYPERPDRCTIYPPDLPRDRQTTTWLTATRDAFVDLRNSR